MHTKKEIFLFLAASLTLLAALALSNLHPATRGPQNHVISIADGGEPPPPPIPWRPPMSA